LAAQPKSLNNPLGRFYVPNKSKGEQRDKRMPQLVKGGKYTYGWSRVGKGGKITIPPEALYEYHLEEVKKLIVLPGSRTSGGFCLLSRDALKKSILGNILTQYPELDEFKMPKGEGWHHAGKTYCWVELQNESIEMSLETLDVYGVREGEKLLVIRGSGLGIGFAVRGPIVESAEEYPELEIF